MIQFSSLIDVTGQIIISYLQLIFLKLAKYISSKSPFINQTLTCAKRNHPFKTNTLIKTIIFYSWYAHKFVRYSHIFLILIASSSRIVDRYDTSWLIHYIRRRCVQCDRRYKVFQPGNYPSRSVHLYRFQIKTTRMSCRLLKNILWSL